MTAPLLLVRRPPETASTVAHDRSGRHRAPGRRVVHDELDPPSMPGQRMRFSVPVRGDARPRLAAPRAGAGAR